MSETTDAAADDILATIAAVAAGHETDENLGDTTERVETIWWLATRGAEGTDWGIR